MNYEFKLPIEYHKYGVLSDIVRSDLEIDMDNEQNILNRIYNPKNEMEGSILLGKWSSIYSNDKKFIKDNQKLIKNYKYSVNEMSSFIPHYLTYKTDPNFMNKFQYIQFKQFTSLNQSTNFLYLWGTYNCCTPLLSLCLLSLV